MNADFYAYEEKHWHTHELIAGADEAGRGPLAGPVCAAAVILPEGCVIEGINDSKKLTPRKRDALYEQITGVAQYKAVLMDTDVIERENILGATRLAFKEAIEALAPAPAFVYTDYITGLDISLPYLSIVKGDAKVYSIAAASIIAKVTRDRLMDEYDAMYPEYGFARHKGYGTKEHTDAIRKYGPCPIHRMSFLKNIL